MSEKRVEIDPNEYLDQFRANTALLVSMRPNGEKNVMALDWKEMEEIDGNPVVRAQVAYSRYTYDLLTEGIKEFTINIPSNMIHSAVSVAGSCSGRNTDKFKKAKLETIPGEKTEVPTLKDCILNYECRIVDTSKSNLSSHHYFYGKILKAYASPDLM
jgi:flavin reductase (DIM6/NTAB) family NADH-FMN oxidoreductase RutF